MRYAVETFEKSLNELEKFLTDLQGKIEVAYRTLIRWLNNDDFPPHRNLVKLANILELEPHQLVIRWTSFTTPWPNESSDAIRPKDTSRQSLSKSLKTRKYQRR